MKPALVQRAFIAIASAAILVACGSHVLPISAPIAQPLGADASRATSRAWGVLVDDPSGKPLGGIPVALEPWKPCVVKRLPHNARTLVCPAPIVTTKTAPNGRFAINAPAGHYLLVIGSDSPADLQRPTIHDNVQLTAGTEHLLAPTPCPTFDPEVRYQHCLPQLTPLVLPAAERSGAYRLTAISTRYERPCITGFDYYRAQRGLEPAVVDEWLTENNREGSQLAADPKYTPPPIGSVWYGWPSLTTGFSANIGGSLKPINGHPGCWTWNVGNAFHKYVNGLPFSGDARTHWLGARLGPWNEKGIQGNLLGNSEYLRDPRNSADPNVPLWP